MLKTYSMIQLVTTEDVPFSRLAAIFQEVELHFIEFLKLFFIYHFKAWRMCSWVTTGWQRHNYLLILLVLFWECENHRCQGRRMNCLYFLQQISYKLRTWFCWINEAEIFSFVICFQHFSLCSVCSCFSLTAYVDALKILYTFYFKNTHSWCYN